MDYDKLGSSKPLFLKHSAYLCEYLLFPLESKILALFDDIQETKVSLCKLILYFEVWD